MDTLPRQYQPVIEISGVHLDVHSGRIRISLEINDQWIEILNEINGDGHISHIVEPAGIRERMKAN